jgi:glycerophosphoryl diester phosphodiesterase
VSDFFIWAHRGASGIAPENTLAAFRAAEASGVDGIEFDVQLSRDGVPVVIHDDTVDRTTDGRGPVRGKSLRQLRGLDAGGWFAPAFADEPLPTVEEVLAWAGERLRLNLEVKAAAAGSAVLELLRSHPRSRVLVSSFDHDLLIRLRRADPALPLAFLIDSRFWRRAVKRAVACGAKSVNPRHDHVSRALVAACHQKGLDVYPWTVDDPGRLEHLLRLGVDGVFTNVPGKFARQPRARTLKGDRNDRYRG